MIDRKDILTLDYYKKERFTGSCQGMRYLIERAKEGDLEQFVVYIWPGPYAFSATKEEKKVKTFPFIKESLDQIVEYLNKVYNDGVGMWNGIL